MIKKSTLYALVIMMMLSIFNFSCSMNDGSLSGNNSLLKLHQTKSLLPSYDYYYVGRRNLPYAVIGLDIKFKLNTKGWFRINDSNSIYQKISNLDDRYGIGVSNRVFPADILDAKKNKIGIWFSYYRYTSIIIDAETKTISILNPYNPNGDFADR